MDLWFYFKHSLKILKWLLHCFTRVLSSKRKAQKFRQALLTQHLIKVEKKDLPKEFKRGIELLKNDSIWEKSKS